MKKPWYTKDYPGVGNIPVDKQTKKKKSLISGAYILMESHRKPPNQVSKIHSIWDADELLEEKYLRMNEA